MLTISLQTALACGGLFCDSTTVPTSVTVPVQQTEEAVVFSIDEAAQTTTMHVQISYEGPVSEFAWILPVSGVPQLERSSSSLFDRLELWTQERWRRTDWVHNSCLNWNGWESDTDTDTDADADTDADTDTDADLPPTVVVVSSQAVGPYDTVVLTATNTDGLMQWLRDNGYQVPDGIEPLLAPYIAPEMHFIALKLQKDRDAGDLEPLGIVLQGTTPSIPMQLTAVAAADDMPLSVYVLGEGRAVSTNYLHVERNLLRAEWPLQGAPDFVGNQPDLVARAVDAAGGQAFATLYAGDVPPPMRDTGFDATYLYASEGLGAWIEGVVDLPADITLTRQDWEVIVPLPVDFPLEADTFYGCLLCVQSQQSFDLITFDSVVATNTLIERVVDPLNRVDALFRGSSRLTRLATALSPSEMTVDPLFGFLQTWEAVSPDHTLDLQRTCGGRDLEDTPYEIQVDDLSFQGPTRKWLNDRDLTLMEWMRNLVPGAALSIHDAGDGRLVTLVDYRDLIPDGVDDVDQVDRACGCDQSAGITVVSFLPLLGLLLRRKRVF